MTTIERLANAVTFDQNCRYKIWDDTATLDSPEYHPGIDFYADAAYSCSEGTVIAAGTDGDTFTVTVQQDVNTIFRYCHLESISVRAGDYLQAGFIIGAALDYVHFEFCTRDAENSKWCVRVGTEQYYKHDPLRAFKE